MFFVIKKFEILCSMFDIHVLIVCIWLTLLY